MLIISTGGRSITVVVVADFAFELRGMVQSSFSGFESVQLSATKIIPQIFPFSSWP